VGEPLEFTIRVTNTTRDTDYSGLKIIDTLPEGMTYVSGQGQNITCAEQAGTVTCNLPNLEHDNGYGDSATTATVTITVIPTKAGTFTNTARLNTEDFPPDSNEGGGPTSVSVTVNEADADNDGVLDSADNCPNEANPGQEDIDGDGLGDVCDPADDRPPTPSDTDSDGVPDSKDNCPNVSNPDQADRDGDGIGDTCDQLPNNKNKTEKRGGKGRPVPPITQTQPPSGQSALEPPEEVVTNNLDALEPPEEGATNNLDETETPVAPS